MAKCQKCNQELTHVDAKATTGLLEGQKIMSLVFSCPRCEALLSVQVHPGALIEYIKQAGVV